jgi:hypothetical protein
MASVSSIKTDITTLGDCELQELFNYIGEMFTLGSLKGSLNNDFKESRFSKGEVCPHCRSTSIVKNDKEIIRTKNILIHSVIPFVDTGIQEYKNRTLVYATKSC